MVGNFSVVFYFPLPLTTPWLDINLEDSSLCPLATRKPGIWFQKNHSRLFIDDHACML